MTSSKNRLEINLYNFIVLAVNFQFSNMFEAKSMFMCIGMYAKGDVLDEDGSHLRQP